MNSGHHFSGLLILQGMYLHMYIHYLDNHWWDLVYLRMVDINTLSPPPPLPHISYFLQTKKFFYT